MSKLKNYVVLGLIVAIIMAVFLCACGAGNDSPENDSKADQEAAGDSVNDATEETLNDTDEDTVKSQYVCRDSIDMSDRRDSFETVLFQEKFTLPIDIASFDGIDEKMKSTARVSPGRFFTIIELDNTDIYIKNYSDETVTIQECLENGWWYMKPAYTTRTINIYNALNIDTSGIEEEYRDGTDNSPYYFAMIEQIGAPSEFNDSVLVYEYDDFTVEIAWTDKHMEEYDINMVEMYDLTYYNPQCWEAQKKSRAGITVEKIEKPLDSYTANLPDSIILSVDGKETKITRDRSPIDILNDLGLEPSAVYDDIWLLEEYEFEDGRILFEEKYIDKATNERDLYRIEMEIDPERTTSLLGITNVTKKEDFLNILGAPSSFDTKELYEYKWKDVKIGDITLDRVCISIRPGNFVDGIAIYFYSL
jgi:hypothetical protein